MEFENDEAGGQAIEKFDGHSLNGRNCRVSEAVERSRTPSFDSGPFSDPRPPKGGRPKGSRRNLRGRKRGFY